MRNLYLMLGFKGIVDDRNTLDQAIRKSGQASTLREQAHFVLLQPARKARYDWALQKALELAEARVRLGLPTDIQLPGSDARTPHPDSGSASNSADARRVWPGWLGISALAVFGLLIWLGASAFQSDVAHRVGSPSGAPKSQTGSSPGRELNPVDPTPRGTAGKLRPIHPPDHGWTQGDTSLILKVPWRIETEAGQDYLLRLLDAKTHAVVLTIFLRGGEPFLGLAPEGEFEFTYASGHEWFGVADGFGPEARVARSERIHRITLGPDESWAWELQLHPTSGEGARIDPVGPVEPDSEKEK